MKLTAESTVINDSKLNTNIDNAQTTAETALDKANGSVVTDTLHYLATSQGSGVTTSTAGWTTTVQAMTATNKYLWTYHTYTKAIGATVDTTPVITGTYGEKGDTGAKGDQGNKGDTGVGVSSVQPEYYLSTSASSLSGGSWSTALTYVSGKYIWTRDKVTYSDNTSNYSTAIYNGALTSACANAQSALQIANDTAQYFWFTSSGSDTGAHISEKTQAEFVANPSGGNLLARSNGIAVRDGLEELATFGADGLRIGRDTERNIKITNDSFNVYYEDASVPFSIKTATSATSQTRTFVSSVDGSSGASNTLTVYPLGEVTNNRYYVGVSTTGNPTDYTQYFENPTSSWSTAKTINGVSIQILKASDAVVYIKYTNTTTSKRYIGARFAEAYRQTTVRVNDANLNTELHSATFTNTTGVCQQIHVYTYGKVAHLYMYCYNTSSVVAGGVLYRGQLLNYVPAIYTSLTGRFENSQTAVPIIGYIDNNGLIYVPNTSPNTLSTSASSMVYLTATYLIP